MYFISTDGHVLKDVPKNKDVPRLDIENNAFENKDEAWERKEELEAETPTLFENKTPAVKPKKPAIVSTGNMRSDIQRQLIEHSNEFWDCFAQLKAKDKCEIFLKMLPYGFAKVPDERPMGEDERQRLILEETTRKATIIGGGLPQVVEENGTVMEDD